MSKKISYPSSSFKNSLDLANVVYELKDCKAETCAAKMNKKYSGAFNEIINGAVKYAMIIRKNGILSPSEAFRNLKLAYTEEESNKYSADLFLSVPLFLEIYEKFKEGRLPVDILPTMLIKDFGVDDKSAGRVANYFIAGAKEVKILNPDNTFITNDNQNNKTEPAISKTATDELVQINKNLDDATLEYVVHFIGPDKLDITLSLKDESDFLVLGAITQKIKNKINENTKSKS